ncbi:MAG: Der GTPase-activating protein YihI [Colwellia sp.]
MSRSKKSRKPGSAPTAKPKLSKVELANVEKRLRKKTGKKPGNRQQEGKQVKSTDQTSNQNKDPRIGSKKPIDLGGNVLQSIDKVKKAKTSKIKQDSPIAAIRVAKSETSIEHNLAPDLALELSNIENDEHLQNILAKQEDDLELTEQEVNYYNDMMERHQQLTEKLGVIDEDTEDKTNQRKVNSEDDLWDKLDGSSLSDDFS